MSNLTLFARNFLISAALAAAGLASLPALPQASSPSPDKPGEPYTLQMNVDRVLLSATVVDGHNALVSGLLKDNFLIREDGIPQPIKDFSHDDLPVTVGILVDNSGSMGNNRANVISAAISFARSSNPLDQIFVINFNDHVTFALPPGTPFTDRIDILRQALASIHSIGMTSLYDAIFAGIEHLNLGSSEKHVLLVITDGDDNISTHTLAQVTALARQSAATLYAIGIFNPGDPDHKPGILTRLARETGGQAFFPESSREIPAICEGIARDIRTQYTLTYLPALGVEDGRFRSIHVTATSPKHGHLSVRTRTGYSVPATTPTPPLP